MDTQTQVRSAAAINGGPLSPHIGEHSVVWTKEAVLAAFEELDRVLQGVCVPGRSYPDEGTLEWGSSVWVDAANICEATTRVCIALFPADVRVPNVRFFHGRISEYEERVCAMYDEYRQAVSKGESTITLVHVLKELEQSIKDDAFRLRACL